MPQLSTFRAADTMSAPVGIARWRAAVAGSVVPLRIDAPDESAFSGRLARTVVDDVSLFDIVATPHVVRRTPELVGRDEARYYKLSLQLQGTAVLEQGGRTAELGPGDLAVYDTHQPYRLTFPGPNRAMVVMFPHALVDLPRDEIDRVTAVRFPSDVGLGRVINPFFVELGRNLDQLAGTGAGRLVHSALDLLVTMLIQELHCRNGAANDPSRSLAREVREYILDNLDDPGLTPSSVARAHHISTRHLYALFADGGEPVSAWIRSRRLECIRRDLLDPLHAARPVSRVAARWGLTDAAHFSRLFKAEYGESPTSYRLRATPVAPPRGAPACGPGQQACIPVLGRPRRDS